MSATNESSNPELETGPRPADVDIVQGGTARVQGDNVSIKQGGTVIVDARQLELFQGAVVYARGDSFKMTASQTGVALARGPATIEQGMSGVVLAADTVRLDKSAAGVVVAREVEIERSASIFLIAKNVSGQVKTLFGTRESLLFALVAGLAGGIAFAITRMLVGSKKKEY